MPLHGRPWCYSPHQRPSPPAPSAPRRQMTARVPNGHCPSWPRCFPCSPSAPWRSHGPQQMEDWPCPSVWPLHSGSVSSSSLPAYPVHCILRHTQRPSKRQANNRTSPKSPQGHPPLARRPPKPKPVPMVPESSPTGRARRAREAGTGPGETTGGKMASGKRRKRKARPVSSRPGNARPGKGPRKMTSAVPGQREGVQGADRKDAGHR